MTDLTTLVVTTNFEFASSFKGILEQDSQLGLIVTPKDLDFKAGDWLHVLYGLVTKVTKPDLIKNVYLLVEDHHSEHADLPAGVFTALWSVFKNQSVTITVVNSAMHHFAVDSKTRQAAATHDAVYKAIKVKHEARLVLMEHFGLASADARKAGEQTYEGLIVRAKFLHALNAPFLTTAIYGS